MLKNPGRKFTGTLLSNYAYYPGAKPGKKHVLNIQYALNSELRLLTRVYSMCYVSLFATEVLLLLSSCYKVWFVRESVDSVCRDGANMQYMQSKIHIVQVILA